MVDIAPELYKEIQRRFQEKYDKAQLFGNPISDMRKKLDAGTATFQDADLFAVEIGSMLSESMIEVLQLDQLPNKQLYYNIAQRTIGLSLQETYGLVSSVAAEVQEELNAAAGIGIRAMTPAVNEDRIHGLVDKAVEAPDQAVLNKILQSPVENLMMSAVDDTVKANAELQSKAGLQPIIRRQVLSKCCDWCSALAGTYKYPEDVPKDVYRRHQNCRCSVEYIGAGKRQDVWSKKVFQEERDKRIATIEEEYQEQNGYYGVPKTWEKYTDTISSDELLKGTNPNFKKVIGRDLTAEEKDYNYNCANCVPAYEMRCRGYHDITAQPISKSSVLSKDPFLAWENANPITASDGVDEIIEYVKGRKEGARIQVVTDYGFSIWYPRDNHTFVAEKENGECIFKDPQSGGIITNVDRYFGKVKEIRYLQIDNLEISDRGVSACKVKK